MHVLATAGHVDHGKSTLVHALTGMQPDRLAEERRRGLTIELGYAWTELDGELLAFVDVPGHQRFIANMLAGLGPAPGVVFVVAADEGWREQSGEHLAAVDALGLRHGLLVITRADLAAPGPALVQARDRIRASSLGEVESVAVSAVTGAGLPALRAALGRLVASLPAPETDGRVRLWVDRAFTITGAGTVVTGTLGAGRIAVGDELEVAGHRVRVRGLESAGHAHDEVRAAARVAVNLRAVPPDRVGRGSALLTPDAWFTTDVLDVRLAGPAHGRAAELMLHVGTAAVAARLRPLGADTARLQLRHALPLAAGDRAALRDPGTRTVAGVVVLDADPPPLRRRGAAAARAAALRSADPADAAGELARRGAIREGDLRRLGFDPAAAGPARRVAGWLVAEVTWAGWVTALRDAVAAHAAREPLAPGLPAAAGRRAAGLPADELVDAVAADAGLQRRDGQLVRPGDTPALGAADAALGELEQWLAADPFRAPERPELAALGLGAREIAVAVRNGRLVRVGADVLLLPDAPARAAAVLAGLPQPFTLSAARQALATTRRVAVPLLEHLDALGVTERVDATHRRSR